MGSTGRLQWPSRHAAGKSDFSEFGVQEGDEPDEDNEESWIAQQLARSMGQAAAPPPAKPKSKASKVSGQDLLLAA